MTKESSTTLESLAIKHLLFCARYVLTYDLAGARVKPSPRLRGDSTQLLVRPRAGRRCVSSASVEILGAKFQFLILGGRWGRCREICDGRRGSGMTVWRPNTSVSHRNTTGLTHDAHKAPRAPTGWVLRARDFSDREDIPRAFVLKFKYEDIGKWREWNVSCAALTK